MSKFKKLVLYLCAICFCGSAFAETITWMVDGQTYATTNCESGGDVTLPSSPSKEGYTFTGWREVVNRGTFATWSDVPTSINGYLSDATHEKKLLKYDYITIEDASGLAPILENMDNYIYTVTSGGNRQISFYDKNDNFLGQASTTTTVEPLTILDGRFYVLYIWHTDFAPVGWYIFSDTTPFKIGYDGVQCNIDVIAYLGNSSGANNKYIYYSGQSFESLSGVWRFVYMGDWATDGKAGWQPAEQLE